MLSPPQDLEETALAAALADGWGLRAASMSYLAVGWGSHHWDVAGGDGTRWFVSVDELENKRASASESLADGFGRLRDSLRSAVALRAAGQDFVVAPVPSGGGPAAPSGGESAGRAGGEPAVRFGGRFAVAVYPFTEGQSFGWDEWAAGLRPAVLGLVTRVHLAPEQARRPARSEDFGVPFLELVRAALDGWQPAECGPYTLAVTRLLREYAVPLGRWLDRYDALVAGAREQPGRNVLTHGEPHPGNVMLTSDGWRLIDWDTVLVAPPERDLWSIAAAGADDPAGAGNLDGAGEVLEAYAAATGVTPRAGLLELYRLKWDIADLAYDTGRFLRPHQEGADEVQSWELLSSLIRGAT
ncbi:MAG TPA: aminoglycoside phosphotransferase family protein [Trebonia sp.]